MVKSIKIAEVILSMDFAWNTQKDNMSDINEFKKEVFLGFFFVCFEHLRFYGCLKRY